MSTVDFHSPQSEGTLELLSINKREHSEAFVNDKIVMNVPAFDSNIENTTNPDGNNFWAVSVVLYLAHKDGFEIGDFTNNISRKWLETRLNIGGGVL
ncbi:hypothetical protein GCM10011335_23540 [Aureimonas glaciei]|uniref:Uncharacterized protein n=1 Tax=Aureimonas glaciei TaxID=1776957 RepID=A0A916XYJ6_9HYPH|nr:hypothetical protein GCM10011335_23540 [Aureimonas glaciei]